MARHALHSSGNGTMFTQTWHATSLHSSGKGTIFTLTWHATSLHLPMNNSKSM
ncbi:MAG: hypothetical protein HDS84_08745 [Bacteroidales bacterium]|nr:hypothetical protein [Bacteroidales bacterium]